MFRCKYEIYDYDLNIDNYNRSTLREYDYLYGESEEEILKQAKELYKKYSLRASLLWQFANNYGDRISHKNYLILITGSDKEIEKTFSDLKYYYDTTDIIFEEIELISEYKPRIYIEKEICPEDIKNELLEQYSTQILKRMKKN